MKSFWVFNCFFSMFVLLIAQPLRAGGLPSPREVLQIGQALPEAVLVRHGKPSVSLSSLKGRVKIISVVPQLNTPTCDEQTHRFSETNGGLDKHLDIITISTNPARVQSEFADKANIHNLTFLSDAPDYDFGTKTGLLNPAFSFLKRMVLVADAENIIRYVDFVPGGGLPQIDRALQAARKVLNAQ